VIGVIICWVTTFIVSFVFRD